jgi:amino acid adenylation domain-containing protein
MSDPVTDADAQTLPDLVLAQCRRTPDAIAVEDADGRSLSFAELDAESARWAGLLRARGAGPDAIVAVHLDRSAQLVVLLLAIVRAGSCYLPLSREDPPARLARVLSSAAPLLVLTDAPGARLMPDVVPLIDVTDDPSDDRADTGLDRAAPEDLAYVIFTSGSTGAPKGVMIEHRAIVNRLVWMQDTLPIGPGDVVAQKTPYTFDVSVWEFFWPLMTGATLASVAPDGHRDPDHLATMIRESRVTVAHFVPSMLAEFLRSGSPVTGSALRRIVVSGEALSSSLARRFFAALPGIELHNLYGPTEAAVDVTHWPCNPADPQQPVPIGKPIAGIRIHILGPDLLPVAAGEVGELCIAGIGLARGYLGRPDLTAERFVLADSLGPETERCYRTGDLARRRPDGAIEYHGRTDSQIKVGGVRLELGEVEAALLDLPGVTAAAAAARTDSSGRTRIAAFVTVTGTGKHTGQGSCDVDHRALLRDVLPPAAVPSTVTVVRAIPTTAHGKADLNALLQLTDAGGDRPPDTADTRGSSTAPLTIDPGTVASDCDHIGAVWHDVLGRDAASELFAAGGGSLDVMRIVAVLREELGLDVPMADFYENPTLDRLIALASPSRGELESLPGTVDRGRPLALGPSQERQWFMQLREPGSTAMNAPTGLRVRGNATAGQISTCFSALLARHEVLRTSFVAERGVPKGVIGPAPAPGDQLLEVIDHPGLDEAARDRAAERYIADAGASPFDLAAGPPLRVSLVRFAPNDHMLVLGAHQVIADGWTWSVLVADFAADWARVAAGADPRPVEPSLQIADHAAWLRRVQTEEPMASRMTEARERWRQRLEGAPDGPRLPRDQPRPTALSVAAASLDVPWAEGFRERLRDFCRREQTTPYTVVLAVFACWLARLSGQDDIMVASPAGNRVPPWTASMAGYFVTTVPHRLDVEPDSTFVQVLARARESVIFGQRNSHVPFEHIIADLGAQRPGGRLPLFQHLLAFQNVPPWQVTNDAGEVRVVQYPNRHTNMELKLEVFPAEPGYDARIVYAVDMFSQARAEAMAGQLALLADQALAEPEGYVEDYVIAGPPPAVRKEIAR